MKRTLISILFLLNSIALSAQQNFTEDSAEAQSLINVGHSQVNKIFTPPVEYQQNLKSAATATGNISVSYINFPEEAKAAFEYAVSIWGESISSPVTINIQASWESIAGNQLGMGKPALFYRNFKGAPAANIYYPVALAEKITGKEYNHANDADIICSFNKSVAWYFGTDGRTPSTKYDFVTAVLHEIGHGLGIAGFFTSENGVAQFANSANLPSVYDYFVFNSNLQRVADKNIFPCPSKELTKQLTSNSLFFNYTLEKSASKSASIYAPGTWAKGMSIYHLEKSSFKTGSPNELMNAFAYKGEAIHNPGENTLFVLSEMGWSVNLPESGQISTEINREVLSNGNLNIYPNPFMNNVTFDCENVSASSNVDIVISDLAGKTVYRKIMNDIRYNPKLKVDLSDIKPGIYLASITDGNNIKITKRLIKN